MKTLVLLLACVFTLHVARGDDVFDPDPNHPWNRLDAAIRTEEPVPKSVEDNLSEEFPKWLFTGAKYEQALAELERFLKRKDDRLIRDPLKRALLQREVWTVFDTVANARGPFRMEGQYRDQRDAITRRAAQIIRLLALTEAEIAALPDNYAATVAAGTFPPAHDPQKLAQPFLPPDLLPLGKAWLGMSGSEDPIALRHAEAVHGRSVFHVQMRLPGGRAETMAYMRKLADFPKPYAWNDSYEQYPYARSTVRIGPDLPQFPAGTQVALVRRMMLADADGDLRSTPIVESVQIRVYVNEPLPDPEMNQMAATEFRLSPKELLRNGSGLLPTGFKAPATRTVFELPTMFDRGVGCSNCHGRPGIYSVQAYAQGFGRNRGSPWFEVARSDEVLNLVAVYWKKRQYDWGLLQGLWSARGTSR